MIVFFKNLFLCVALNGLIAPFAIAQAQLDELISRALENNPEINMKRYESQAAKTKISVARQLPDPEITIAAMNVPTNFNLTSEQMTMVPQVTVMQMLPWFGKLSAAGNAAKYSYNASRDQLSNASLEVVAMVKKVYAEIYAAQKTLAYLEYKKKLFDGVLKTTNQLFAVGLAPQQDVFRAAAELTMTQSEIITMNGMLQQQYDELAVLVGSNEPLMIEIDTLQLQQLLTLSTLDSTLVENNPSLSQMSNIKESAKAQNSFARSDAIPDFRVGIGYGYRGAEMPDGTKAPNMINFEIGISVPIFFESKQNKMIEETKLMEQAADQEYRATSLSLRNQLRSMYTDAEAKYQIIPLYSEQLIPQYAATYDASITAYSVGKTSFTMLIDNLKMLVNAKIELVKIESSYFSTEAEISKLIGENSERYRGEK